MGQPQEMTRTTAGSLQGSRLLFSLHGCESVIEKGRKLVYEKEQPLKLLLETGILVPKDT